MVFILDVAFLDIGLNLGVDQDMELGIDQVALRWTVLVEEKREPMCVLVVPSSVPQNIPAGSTPLLARRSSDTPSRPGPSS